jgi:hypothetical protein|tara:strand:+ start:65 stop:553 length:489 start_codon:yes stop_codon:yes gene_type:complete
MVSKEQSIPLKIDIAKRAYDFAKTKNLTELIEGLEITKENINLEKNNLISNEAIITYEFSTEERGKYETLVFGRLYFSDDIDGNQNFLFKLEDYPPILENSIEKYIRSNQIPKMTLESSKYIPPPKKYHLSRSSRNSNGKPSEKMTFKSHFNKGDPKHLWKV